MIALVTVFLKITQLEYKWPMLSSATLLFEKVGVKKVNWDRFNSHNHTFVEVTVEFHYNPTTFIIISYNHNQRLCHHPSIIVIGVDAHSIQELILSLQNTASPLYSSLSPTPTPNLCVKPIFGSMNSRRVVYQLTTRTLPSSRLQRWKDTGW